MARTVSLLDRVRIASPCDVPWASMTGDDKVRFCDQCKLNVYNVVSMSRDEAEALIREREGGRVCLRLYLRRDGTIITKDCPVGLAAARKRLAKMLTGTAAVFVAMLSMGFAAAGKARFALRLKHYAPFARLTDWLDPPAVFTSGDAVVDVNDSDRRIVGASDEPVFPVMADGNPYSSEAECSDSRQDNSR